MRFIPFSFIMFFLLIFAQPAFSNSTAFDMAKDGLCFRNGDDELRRFGLLGKLGNKEGICQGMSGIVSAFHEHASFRPDRTKLNPFESYLVVKNIIHLHAGGCSTKKKLKVDGYKNLQEFCEENKDLLMRVAINYNADIALNEISWNLDFLIKKDAHLKNNFERVRLHSTLEAMRKYLSNGRWPLMLYYRHVVTVHSLRDEVKNGVKARVVLGLYDSNYLRSIEYSVPYNQDKLPAKNQKMLWNVTPNRLTKICW